MFKGKKIALRIIISYLIGPFGCDVGFFAVIRSKELLAQGKNLFFIFGLDLTKIFFRDFSDKCKTDIPDGIGVIAMSAKKTLR